MEIEKVARAFIHQPYPLTPYGETARLQITQALTSKDGTLSALAGRLPTVENPHLELFKDLALSEDQKREIFGWELQNVQVTKGCRHKCEFCAAGAAPKVERMPFVGILKIGEVVREVNYGGGELHKTGLVS